MEEIIEHIKKVNDLNNRAEELMNNIQELISIEKRKQMLINTINNERVSTDKGFLIRWIGKVTIDCGYFPVLATSIEEAERIFWRTLSKKDCFIDDIYVQCDRSKIKTYS